MTTITLQPGQQETIDAAGRFVFFEAGTAKLYVGAIFPATAEHEMRSMETGILLDPRDQARWEQRFTSLRLINQGAAAQTVTLKISDAQYFPKQDGGAVTITGQTVPVQVVFDPGAPPQEVVINGGVNVDGSTVVIDGQTVVLEVEENAANGITAGAPVVPGVGGTNIPANADRLYLLIRADQANDGGPIMVAGVPLYNTDPPMRVDGTMAVPVVASDADDIVYYHEVTRA